MKIGFISNLYPPHHMGGYGLYCRTVARALMSKGHEVFVITSMHRSNRDAEDTGTKIFRELWFDPAGDSLFLTKRNEDIIRRILDSHSPDCLLVWNTYGLGHSSIFNVVGSWPTAVYLMLYDLAHFGPRLTENILLLAASQTIRFHFLARGIPAERLRLLTPGLEIPEYERDRKQKYRIPILFSGRIVMYKGLHTVLEALENLPDAYTLSICGTADADSVTYENECKDWVRRRNLDERVHFLGWVPQKAMPGLYDEHVVLVFPSIWEEPFGLSILEAMSYGMAVVASRLGGPAEILSDKRTGLLFEPGDVSDLTNKLLSLRDPVFRTVLGEAARDSFVQRYSLDRFITELEILLQTLVDISPE